MSDDIKREAKVSQNLVALAKEITLLTYTNRQLNDTIRELGLVIKALREELNRAKVIQVPYPVYPTNPTPLNIPPLTNPGPIAPTKPYVGDPIPPPYIFNNKTNG